MDDHLELRQLTRPSTKASTTGASQLSVSKQHLDDVDNAERASMSVGVMNMGSTTIGANTSYINGFKLFAVLASVTLAAFLMLLDGSIVGVVS